MEVRGLWIIEAILQECTADFKVLSWTRHDDRTPEEGMNMRDSSRDKPRYFSSDGKQVRNRHSSAGITAREASSLWNYMNRMRAISEKNNLFIGYKRRLVEAADLIEELLRESDRL